jgi:decaprenylphospho-beta-D-ribofuranose 2-oxidase
MVIPSGCQPTELTNWSKTGRSACLRLTVADVPTIREALDLARRQSLSIIAHGAGHCYTDAAWNSGGAVLDLTSMRRILSWDPVQGIIEAEPGVTLQQMLELVWMDGWWPYATPSTPQVTLGGCAAMNINGKNARTCGTFGEHLLSIEVLLSGGDLVTLAPERDPELFYAVVGGLGLLGIITRVTMQLQRVPSGQVLVKKQSATSLAEVIEICAEQQPKSDFIEAWLDGFALGPRLGRGEVTSAVFGEADPKIARPRPKPGLVDRLAAATVRRTGRLFRPVFVPSVPMANQARYWWGRRAKGRLQTLGQRSLLAYTYYSPAAFAGYHQVLPQGFETFQAFVPAGDAHETFLELLRYSQKQGCLPIWCIIKAHRHDPFLLSYQVDGFSLELYYPRDSRIWPNLEKVLCRMIEIALSAGGRFYLAKDHFMTAAQYRLSLGDSTIEAFLRLKRRLDPEGLWQSDLYRRLFA